MPSLYLERLMVLAAFFQIVIEMWHQWKIWNIEGVELAIILEFSMVVVELVTILGTFLWFLSLSSSFNWFSFSIYLYLGLSSLGVMVKIARELVFVFGSLSFLVAYMGTLFAGMNSGSSIYCSSIRSHSFLFKSHLLVCLVLLLCSLGLTPLDHTVKQIWVLGFILT